MEVSNCKKYEFTLGQINDELVEEYKSILLKVCKFLEPDSIGYKISNGEFELTDEIVFQSAVCFAKDYLENIFKDKER